MKSTVQGELVLYNSKLTMEHNSHCLLCAACQPPPCPVRMNFQDCPQIEARLSISPQPTVFPILILFGSPHLILFSSVSEALSSFWFRTDILWRQFLGLSASSWYMLFFDGSISYFEPTSCASWTQMVGLVAFYGINLTPSYYDIIDERTKSCGNTS